MKGTCKGLAWIACVWLAAAQPGCQWLAGGGDDPAAATRTGKLLGKIREANGCASMPQGLAGVRFSYAIRPGKDAPTTTLAEVAFWLDDFRYIWIAPQPESAPVRLDLSGSRDDLARQLAAAGVLEERAVPAARRAPGNIIFALRSIRYLLAPALATTAGQWTFRSILTRTEVQAPLLEVVPLEPGAPVGPCLLDVDSRSLRLRAIVYAIKGRTRLFRLSLRGYQNFNGFPIATRRYHRQAKEAAGKDQEPDPFGLASEEDLEDAFSLLREDVGDVAFLDRAAMQTRYRRPQDGEPSEGETLEGETAASRSEEQEP